MIEIHHAQRRTAEVIKAYAPTSQQNTLRSAAKSSIKVPVQVSLGGYCCVLGEFYTSARKSVNCLCLKSYSGPLQLLQVLQNTDVTQVAKRYFAAQRGSGTYAGWLLGKIGDEIFSHSVEDIAHQVAITAKKDADSRSPPHTLR